MDTNPPKEICYNCQQREAEKTLLGVCRQCYEQTAKILRQYKNARSSTFPEINEILPRVYLGNEDAATNRDIISKHGIRAVLVCGTLLESPFEQELRYKKLPIHDDPRQSIIDLFDDAVDFVHEQVQQDRSVLIHCAAGISRSASFTIAYLMKHKKMSYKDGMSFVKQRRHVIHPNSGFVSQLQQYEKQLTPK